MNEFRGQFAEVMAITELRGSYPAVPIAPDVDYAALVAGDDNPVFLTIPIGKAGVTSGNKRHYDDAFVLELERQTLTNKPIGLMGHLSEQDRATAFPPEAVHWVGALREGDTLWGKAYVVPGPVRDRIQRYKAQGKAIATSIDAFAEGIWDEAMKAFRMAANTLRLNQIDIAPADRAGIPALAAVPLLTTEMEQSDAPNTETPEQEPEMDKLQVINEMTADDARLLPESVRQAVVAAAPPPDVALVQELRQVLGVDDRADLKGLVVEMRRQQDEQRQAAVARRIVELAAPTADKGIKVDGVRELVIDLVTAHHPQTVAEAETAYGQVIEMASVKTALAAAVQTAMGPRQGLPVQPQANLVGKYFNIPQEG